MRLAAVDLLDRGEMQFVGLLVDRLVVHPSLRGQLEAGVKMSLVAIAGFRVGKVGSLRLPNAC